MCMATSLLGCEGVVESVERLGEGIAQLHYTAALHSSRYVINHPTNRDR